MKYKKSIFSFIVFLGILNIFLSFRNYVWYNSILLEKKLVYFFTQNQVSFNQDKQVLSLGEDFFYLDSFPTYDQKEKYPKGCEIVSLYLLLKYQGIEASLEEMVELLKKGDAVYEEDGVFYGGHPEYEFVGDPRIDINSYGVFENPIIEVANYYKSGIKKATGQSLEELLQIVESGHPVQVWVSSYERSPIACKSWIHKATFENIIWYCNFHSMILIGEDHDKVIVSDPLIGNIEYYNRSTFLEAYEFYGRRAIYYE